MSSLDLRMRGRRLFEAIYTVDQLGLGSEVTSIGIKATCLQGELVEIIDWRMSVNDLAANKSAYAQHMSSDDSMIRNLGVAGLDNNGMQKMIHMGADNGAGGEGSALRTFLGEDQYMQWTITDTLDATKTITVHCQYAAYIYPLTFAAVGAGITLTKVSHKNIGVIFFD